jgi:Secretion system C-terminal sorting domain
VEILATSANGPIWTLLPATSGALCLRVQDLDIFAGMAIRFEISFRAAVAGDIIFDDFQLSVPGAPLPVTFLGFVSRREPDGSIRLLWDVADEIDVRGYEVERSSNGRDFTRVGSVDATGKSRYSYTDATAIKGTYYYRVRNVDFNGEHKYTGILRVSVAGPDVNTIQLYPVPAQDYVYLQHEKAPAKGVVRLISVDGRVLKRMETVPNSQQTNIILSGLKAGLYLVQYDDGEGNSQTLKLVKQ